MRSPGERRRPVDARNQCGLCGIADVVDGESAITPRRIAAVTGSDHVMQGDALAFGQVRLAGGAVHAGQPPFGDDLRLGSVLQVDDAQDVVGEAVEVRRDIGVASSRPPQAVDPEAGHFEEGNLAHFVRPGDVVDGQAGPEFLAVGDAVGQVVLEVAAHAVIGLHRHDVGAVGEQHQIVRNLQVMGARVLAGGEKARGFQVARVRRIQNGDAVAEHVPNVNVLFVDHHLYAVRPSADVAVGNVLDALPDSLRRNFGIGSECGRRQAGHRSGPSQRTELFQVLTARKFRHGRYSPEQPICLPSLQSGRSR